MTSQLLKAMPQNASCFGRTAKLMSVLLILLNTQLHIGQATAAAKTSVRFQLPKNVTPQRLYITSAKPATAKPELKGAICPAQLPAAIETVTGRSQFQRARWGIVIQTLSTAQNLYSHDAQNYFIPASNVKLLTTAAALHQLGAEFRIRTSIYGTNDGALRVVGRGDPSLTDIQLRELAQQLSRRGIRQVKLMITENNYFRGYAVNPSWEWEDLQADYGAPVNSLILNQNAVTLTLLPQQIGQPLRLVWADPTEAKQWQIENQSVTVSSDESASINVTRDWKESRLTITGKLGVNSAPETVSLAVITPQRTFLQHFRQALIAEGIQETTNNSIGYKLRLAAAPELAAVVSPPLSQLLVETNQNSNNLYAEALLRTLGAKVGNRTATTDATAEIGLRVVKAALMQLGVDPTGYVLVDGSGLSRHNLVSPQAIAQTLRAMAKSPLASVYRASLSVAGVGGTLQNRFRNTNAQGSLQAKTGTLSGIVALSGYLDAANYEPLVFSIIVNQSDQPSATLKQAVDEIVLLLTRLRPC